MHYTCKLCWLKKNNLIIITTTIHYFFYNLLPHTTNPTMATQSTPCTRKRSGTFVNDCFKADFASPPTLKRRAFAITPEPLLSPPAIVRHHKRQVFIAVVERRSTQIGFSPLLMTIEILAESKDAAVLTIEQYFVETLRTEHEDINTKEVIDDVFEIRTITALQSAKPFECTHGTLSLISKAKLAL